MTVNFKVSLKFNLKLCTSTLQPMIVVKFISVKVTLYKKSKSCIIQHVDFTSSPCCCQSLYNMLISLVLHVVVSHYTTC